MSARNTSVQYGYVAQSLHWAIVALLVVQVTLAKIAEGLPLGLDKLAVLARHKSFGITILGLAAARLAWRMFNRPPLLPPMPRWQAAVAHANHWALYALLFAMPVTGWLMSSASNYPVSWFGVFQLPDFVAPDRALKERFEGVHETLANLLIALAILHIAAALKHHFLDRNGLLFRMLPWGSR
jgi:cytochrome b561